jgi:putative nucleotidyltransferase with HDIG domain
MPTELAEQPQPLVMEAVRKVATLATLPEITAQIIHTVEDPSSTAARLHQIISHDPALVTRILKVVNSAFYGLPGQIASVERAIVLLGLNAVKNIAVAASLGQLFRGVQLGAGYTARDLWTHCIAVAVTARELARQMKLPIVDEAFLAGMIHDIGILISLQSAPERLRQVCERAASSDEPYCAIEEQVMGMTHQQLGAALATLWKFPRSCQLVAGHHHDPESLGGEGRQLVALVHVADLLCCQAQQGFSLTARHGQLDSPGVALAQVDAAVIQQTAGKIPELIKSASPLLAA